MLAGIDVGHRSVVIAYKKNNRIKFIKIKRDTEDKIIAYSILEKFIQNGISEVAIEDPEILNEDTLNINPSEENCKDTKNIVSFLEKLKEIAEKEKFDYQIIEDNGILKKIIIKGKLSEDALKKIFGKIAWSFERAIEKPMREEEKKNGSKNR